MNDIKQKIEAEIQFAIENNRNCVTIVIDSVSNNDLMKIVRNITDSTTSIRINRYDDKIHIHVYWSIKNK